jgi:hypothetical protein
MTRQEHLERLSALNEALCKRGVEPTFSDAALAAMSNRGLQVATKLTEEDLLRATKTLAEE